MIAVWALVAFSTTITVIVLRTRQVKQVVKDAVESLEKRVDEGLGDIEKSVQAEIKAIDGRISAKVDSIAIPKLPENMEERLTEIYDAIPGTEDWDALSENITGQLAQYLASMEGVRQKQIYEFMNANEEGFKALDAETQALAISNMDVASMAMQELAAIKMSKSQAAKTPVMAAGLNIGKVLMSQVFANMKQGAVPGMGHVSIEGRGSGGYNPGFNP